MSLANITKLIRETDKRWQRRNKPGRSVLVDARTAMNYSVVAPIHRAMRSDDRLRFYFTASEMPAAARQIYREAGDGITIVRPARAALIKFDAYLAADMLWAKLPRGAQRVQMFHGVAGKYRRVYDAPDRSMREWDRIFFINRHRFENYIQSGAIDRDSSSARLVGYPKLDCLVDGSLNRDEVLLQLGIDPARQTVLYAPTWSPYSSLNSMGEELVKSLVAARYAVIVKLHDRSHDPRYIHSGGIDWAARLEPLLRRGGGWLADGSDACPYLAAADALITDHSSVGFEYLLLDRPVVRIEMPELISRTDVNTEYVELLAEASTTVTNAEEAVRAVKLNLADSARLSGPRKAVAEELFHKPGSATSRAVRELYEVIELDPL